MSLYSVDINKALQNKTLQIIYHKKEIGVQDKEKEK